MIPRNPIHNISTTYNESYTCMKVIIPNIVIRYLNIYLRYSYLSFVQQMSPLQTLLLSRVPGKCFCNHSISEITTLTFFYVPMYEPLIYWLTKETLQPNSKFCITGYMYIGHLCWKISIKFTYSIMCWCHLELYAAVSSNFRESKPKFDATHAKF